MKNNLLCIVLLLASVMLLTISCDPIIEGGGDPRGASIGIFRLRDSSYLQNVRAIVATEGDTLPSSYYKKCGNYYIPTYPRLRSNEPFFSSQYFIAKGQSIADHYDICELATAQKYIPLKDGFYMCYPYLEVSEGSGCQFLNVKWEDICTADFDTVRPLVNLNEFPRLLSYWGCYIISERDIVRFTGKSTDRFKGKSKEKVMIDDIVALFNRMLEDGTIDDCCTPVSYRE